MKIKLLVTLLACVGIGTVHSFEIGDAERIKEFVMKEKYFYEVCGHDWESSECAQAREAFAQCATQLYPQLPQSALKFIAHEREKRIAKHEALASEAAIVEGKGTYLARAQAYEEQELARVKEYIK